MKVYAHTSTRNAFILCLFLCVSSLVTHAYKWLNRPVNLLWHSSCVSCVTQLTIAARFFLGDACVLVHPVNLLWHSSHAYSGTVHTGSTRFRISHAGDGEDEGDQRRVLHFHCGCCELHGVAYFGHRVVGVRFSTILVLVCCLLLRLLLLVCYCFSSCTTATISCCCYYVYWYYRLQVPLRTRQPAPAGCG